MSARGLYLTCKCAFSRLSFKVCERFCVLTDRIVSAGVLRWWMSESVESSRGRGRWGREQCGGGVGGCYVSHENGCGAMPCHSQQTLTKKKIWASVLWRDAELTSSHEQNVQCITCKKNDNADTHTHTHTDVCVCPVNTSKSSRFPETQHTSKRQPQSSPTAPSFCSFSLLSFFSPALLRLRPHVLWPSV